MQFTKTQIATGLGILAALGGIVTMATQCLNQEVPTPDPSASPSAVVSVLPSPSPLVPPSPTASPSVAASPTQSPSPLPSPSPSIAPSPSPSASAAPSPSPSASVGPTASLLGVVGETLSYEFTAASSWTPPAVQGLTLALFQKLQVTTNTASFQGAPTGAYDDPLVPMASASAGKRYWLDVTATASGSYSIAGLGVSVSVKPNVMKSLLPFYAELTFSNVSSAHGLADQGSTLNQRCALNAQYRALVRAHFVEPIKQGITLLPAITAGQVDLTLPFTGSGCEFGNTVVAGAIAPPAMFGPNSGVTTATLAGINASISSGKLPAGSWAYSCDESNCSTSVTQAVKTGAPLLKVMATVSNQPGGTASQPAYVASVDQFYPVINWINPGGTNVVGSYVSCMSQGTCSNGSPAAATGYPMFLIDAPRAHERAFPWILKHYGPSRGLYYDLVQNLSTAWNAGGQYYSGGNGDGTLLYPGITGQNGLTSDQPLPSIRLKELRRGLQDFWYLSQGKSYTDPVASGTSFPQTDAGFEAVRQAIWNQL